MAVEVTLLSRSKFPGERFLGTAGCTALELDTGDTSE